MDDKTLVQKIIAKDPRAERLFYDTYRPKLERLATYLLGYRDGDIEDAVQESFLAALQSLPEFEFRSSLYHWLYRICVNRCYERLRQRIRQVASADEELEIHARDAAVRTTAGNEEEQRRREILDLIAREREAMGEPCRGILRMRDADGKSYAAISEELRVPLGTVMSRLARCKEELKRIVLKAMRQEEHHG